ncbi:MAG TPA: peptidoglycan DD-metalloendopeptidase family protein [Steroidobacteraceae bacterium]|jgi:murein DD-endopeptidase MepM/ murein hydrolase activator NlpD|nr:peptidoglycan DD-metalloendopeptidase family protein [Steroidobacteraceae bacterium]
MPLDLKLVAKASIGRLFSAVFWLQLSACAVVGWTLLHGGVSPAPAGQAATPGTGNSAVAVAPEAASAGATAREAASASGTAVGSGQDMTAGSSAPTQLHTELANPPLSTTDVTVTRNDTLDRIFRRLKLNLADLASLRNLPGIRHALDSLRPGEALHFTHHDGALFGLERRLNETQTLKVSRDGQALRADVLQNPVEIRTRTIRGVIDSSLFEAVAAAGAHDQVAVALADIFGWDIDFVLDVRSGDTFVVTYEELWRDGAYLHDGAIEAAEFINQGRTFRAVRYADPDGHAQYYTPEGRSLHKAFLRAPVEFTRVSSRFNSARYHPILNLIRAHKGVDYAAPIGTPVHAAGDGHILVAGRLGGYGNCIEIEHSRSIVTVYGHLSRFARGIRAGAHVAQGALIGYVGMTGLATGPHLHYEYRVNGVFKNPQTVSLPAASPIDARWREDFLARTAPLLASLEAPTGPMLVAR